MTNQSRTVNGLKQLRCNARKRLRALKKRVQLKQITKADAALELSSIKMQFRRGIPDVEDVAAEGR